MDWVEKWLHVSPDGGNGTFEFVVFLVLVTVAVLSALRAWRARREHARRNDFRR